MNRNGKISALGIAIMTIAVLILIGVIESFSEIQKYNSSQAAAIQKDIEKTDRLIFIAEELRQALLKMNSYEEKYGTAGQKYSTADLVISFEKKRDEFIGLKEELESLKAKTSGLSILRRTYISIVHKYNFELLDYCAMGIYEALKGEVIDVALRIAKNPGLMKDPEVLKILQDLDDAASILEKIHEEMKSLDDDANLTEEKPI